MTIYNQIFNFLLPCWMINLSLNGIYVAKLLFPMLKLVDKPIDGRLLLFNKRILGDSTTILGLVVALTVASLGNVFFEERLWVSLLYGLTVYLGHALGSFIKRRFNFADGEFMPFVDHGDYIILSGLVLGALGIFEWQIILYGVLINYIIHPLITYLGYLLSLHKEPL